MKGLILAAGRGTRMRPLTDRRPKPLVPVVNRPMIEHVILGAASAGVDDFAIVIGYRGEQLRRALGDGSSLGVRLTYVLQEVQDGTGGATRLCRDFVADEPFFLSFADIVTPRYNYPPFTTDFEAHRPAATIGLNWMEDPYEGAAVYEQGGVVQKLIEKPPRGTSTTHWNNAGIFVFSPVIFEAIAATPLSERGEYELPQAIQTLLEWGRLVRAVEVRDFRSDVARPSELLVINRQMIAAETGNPEGRLVADSVQLSSDATLLGPVALAAGVRIGAATIGPNACLGADVVVEDGVCLRDAAIFARARLGANARLQHAIVEEGAAVPPRASAAGTPTAPALIAS